ncbi:MAG: short-chain dehydrogenase [Gammaproteobacteria bacterium]|nr:short-chain dehydrogenase [Gammaproteobacteria bacterium]
MNGKRILITGGNSGIGLVAATELAKQGAEIVLACRPTEKTEAAISALNFYSTVPVINLEVDLASLDSVRNLAKRFLDSYQTLDVLVNNAGVFPPKQQITEDGFEMQFAVNHLSHFLLSNLLLDCLKSSSPSRVVTISSMLHKKGKVDSESFRGYENYNSSSAYNNSKLYNVLFALELAERTKGTGVTSNVLHPGAVATDIVRDMPWIIRKIIGLVFMSPEKGAQTTIKLASEPELEGVTGKYFDQLKLDECASLAHDQALRKSFWDKSAELVNLGHS